MAAVAGGDWTYIRREGDRREEFFDTEGDARESRNLANDPAQRPTLDRMRTTLDDLTAGPLTPDRFAP